MGTQPVDELAHPWHSPLLTVRGVRHLGLSRRSFGPGPRGQGARSPCAPILGPRRGRPVGDDRGVQAVVVRGLRVVRGTTVVLPDLSLTVEAGTVTGLLGPSGSGKTTLMRALVGVQRVAAGSVDVLGVPAGSPRLRSRVAYVTQAPSVYGDLSVRENLVYFARPGGAGGRRRCRHRDGRPG
jgi:ABC-type multidrug transport system fused ATPase/permease subunit